MFDPDKIELSDIDCSGVPAWFSDENKALWMDNKVAHDAILHLFENVIGRIQACEDGINTLSQHVNTIYERLGTIPEINGELFQQIKYRPNGKEDYLTLGKNFDHIYERIEALENGLQ